MFVRTNAILHKYCKCSAAIKIIIFKSQCINLYDSVPWSRFSVVAMNHLRSCCHRCLRTFFRYERRYSTALLIVWVGTSQLANGISVFFSMCGPHMTVSWSFVLIIVSTWVVNYFLITSDRVTTINTNWSHQEPKRIAMSNLNSFHSRPTMFCSAETITLTFV